MNVHAQITGASLPARSKRISNQSHFLPPGVHNAADLRRHYKGTRSRLNGESDVVALPVSDVAELIQEELRKREPRERDWLIIDHTMRFNTAQETAKQIVASVSQRHGVSADEVMGPRRHKELVKARHESMYLIRQYLPRWSLPRIGRFFGARDHTTVMHGVRKHEKRMKDALEAL